MATLNVNSISVLLTEACLTEVGRMPFNVILSRWMLRLHLSSVRFIPVIESPGALLSQHMRLD
jgi:hypothetical protein